MMNFKPWPAAVLALTLTSLSAYANTSSPLLTLNLSEAPQATFYHGQEQVNDGEIVDVVDNNGNISPFKGWQFNWQFSNGLTNDNSPDVQLHVQPVSGDPRCEFQIYNAANDTCQNDYLLSVATNGQAVRVNPSLPTWYFLPFTQYPTPKCSPTSLWPTPPAPTSFSCAAQVYATADYQGQTITSNKIAISATFNPASQLPTQPTYPVTITINNVWPQNFLAEKPASLPVFADSQSNPFATAHTVSQGWESNANIYQIKVTPPTTDVHLVASNTTINVTDSEGNPGVEACYPVFSFTDNAGNLHSGESLDFSATNDMTITANWTCDPNTPMQDGVFLSDSQTTHVRHTVSSAVMTRNRFEYGTFSTIMEPAQPADNTDGTAPFGLNSSFYGYTGDPSIVDPSTGSDYSYGYNWHEIDFEFLPGNHDQTSLSNLTSNMGFSRAFASANTIAHAVSTNVFSPGNYSLQQTGAQEHHRYCPNTLDPQCLFSPSDPNYIYDNQFHVFTFTWSPTLIKWYVDGHLLTQYTIQDNADGNDALLDENNNPNVKGNMQDQLNFNASTITTLENGQTTNVHTAPMNISMNLWEPTVIGYFGGVLLPFDQNTTVLAKYKAVQWSPCVTDDGQVYTTEDACLNNGGQWYGRVYNAHGELLPTEDQKSYTWDFTNPQTQQNFWQDWQYQPAQGFSYNNTSFMQNDLLFDAQNGLELCLTDQWSHIAQSGHTSTACNGKMLLPVPGTVPSDYDNMNMATVLVQAVFAPGTSQTILNAASGQEFDGILPAKPANYPGYVYLDNNDWGHPTDADDYPGTDCHGYQQPNQSVPGYFCNSSGFYADPEFSVVDNGPFPNQMSAFYVTTLQTDDASGDPISNWTLQPSSPVIIAGQTCHASYSPSILSLQPQGSYTVTATINC